MTRAQHAGIVASITGSTSPLSAPPADLDVDSLRLQREDVLHAVYEISRTAAHVFDPGRIEHTTTERLRQLFRADTAAVWLWNEANGSLYRLVSSHSPRKTTARNRLEPGESLAGQVFASRVPQVVEDYRGYPHALPDVAASGIRSAMAAPLLVDESPVGVLVVGSVEPRSFTRKEREVLAFFADQLAPVAQGIELRSQLRRQRAMAETLADVARQAVKLRSLNALAALLSRHTVKLLGADYAAVGLVDELNKLGAHGAFGVRSSTWGRRRRLLEVGMVRDTLECGETIVRQLGGSPGNGHAPDVDMPGHAAEGAQAAMTTPLPSQRGLRGVLTVGWRSAITPTRDDVRLFETLAAFGGSMIDNVNSHGQASRLALQLQTVIDQMPSGVCVIDAGGKIILNQAGRHIFGGAQHISLPDDFSVRSPGFRRAFEKVGLDFDTTAIAAALRGESVAQREHQIAGPEGSRIWLHASATPLRDARGKRAGAVCIFADVTQLKLAEERRARESERRLASAAIGDALSSASRNVDVMLQIACRELGQALSATCVISLLEGDHLRLVQRFEGEPNADPDPVDGESYHGQVVPVRSSMQRSVLRSALPERWFDSAGLKLSPALPENMQTLFRRAPLYAILVAPLRAHGQVLGTIGLYRHQEPQAFTEDDELFAQDVADRAGLVLENGTLFQELSSSRERLEDLSRRLVGLQEVERRGMALELHDEVGQGLTAVRLLLQAARRLPARLRDERLDEACRALDESIAQIRGLSLDLRPPMLDRFGLAPALEAYFERYTGRTGIQVEFGAGALTDRPSPEVEIAAYRIVQEGLTNVARHATVNRVEVGIWSDKRHVCVWVADQGVGFDPDQLHEEPSTGLTGMQERAELLGGELTIDSSPGGGTRLLARLPLELS